MQIEFTTRGLLGNIFRQSRKVVTVFLLIVLTGMLYISTTKPVYESSGSLLVKFGHDTPEQLTDTGSGTTVISQDNRRETMQSDMDIMQSHDIMAAVVSEVGPENIYPGTTKRVEGKDLPTEAVIRRLVKGDLIVKSSLLSNVIEIRMDNENAEIAALFIHRLMEIFIARQSQIFNNAQTDFLQEQVRQAAAKLETSQRALADYKSSKGISSINDELSELLRQKSDTGAAALEPVDSAWDKVSELESEEKRLLMTYRPDSPQVIRAHQSVQLAKEQLRERQGEIKARTGSATAKIDRRITALEAQRKGYDDLVRQVDIDEKNYKNLLAHSEEAILNDKLSRRNITSVVVVDEPIVNLKPAYPRKTLILIICLLAGVVSGLGAALAFETFDQRFTTPQQLSQALGIPVMATFSAGRGGNA